MSIKWRKRKIVGIIAKMGVYIQFEKRKNGL